MATRENEIQRIKTKSGGVALIKQEGYLNANEFKAIMQDEGWQVSKAVQLYLDRAAHFKRLRSYAKRFAEQHPEADIFPEYVGEYENKRAESVQNALDTAQAEAGQHWRFIEDADEFKSLMRDMYQGNIHKASRLEQAQFEYINTLYRMAEKQARGNFN